MGPDAAHEGGVGRVPPKGDPHSDGAATAEGTGRRLSLPPAGGCDGGVGLAGGGDLRLLPPEHNHTVYCDQANYGPVSGRESKAGAKGGNGMVGIGGFGFGGDAGGGPGGGADSSGG